MKYVYSASLAWLLSRAWACECSITT